jgi:hypothetical protein
MEAGTEGAASCLLHVRCLTFSRASWIHEPVFALAFMTSMPLFLMGCILLQWKLDLISIP